MRPCTVLGFPASRSLPVVERIPEPAVGPVATLSLAVRSKAPSVRVARSATVTPRTATAPESTGKFGTPVGITTESATAGTNPPPQLVATAQSVEVAPVQVRVVPLTSNERVPVVSPALVAVMLQVALRTPVTVPPASTVAQLGSAVPKVTTAPGIPTPTAVLATAASGCVLPGWSRPYDAPGRWPSRVT